MKKFATALCALSLFSWGTAQAQQSAKGATLQAHITYTGNGVINQAHKIYVVLWSSPDFVKPTATDAMPFAITSIASKSATATFQDVRQNPVYLSMAYDPTGKWDGKTAPPVGASLGLYSTEPGTPAPIQLHSAKPTDVSVALDDSYQKPEPEKKP